MTKLLRSCRLRMCWKPNGWRRVWRSKYGRTYLEIETARNAELREKFAAANSAKAEIELTLVALNDSNDQLADQLTSVRAVRWIASGRRGSTWPRGRQRTFEPAARRYPRSAVPDGRGACAIGNRETRAKIRDRRFGAETDRGAGQPGLRSVAARYRSEFFGKLRAVLGERPDVRVVRRSVRFPVGGVVRRAARRNSSRPGRRSSASWRRP